MSTLEPVASQPDEAIRSVRSAVSEWQGKEEPQDDQTVVVVVVVRR